MFWCHIGDVFYSGCSGLVVVSDGVFYKSGFRLPHLLSVYPLKINLRYGSDFLKSENKHICLQATKTSYSNGGKHQRRLEKNARNAVLPGQTSKLQLYIT